MDPTLFNVAYQKGICELKAGLIEDAVDSFPQAFQVE